jgi:hypothetical protein
LYSSKRSPALIGPTANTPLPCTPERRTAILRELIDESFEKRLAARMRRFQSWIENAAPFGRRVDM